MLKNMFAVVVQRVHCEWISGFPFKKKKSQVFANSDMEEGPREDNYCVPRCR